MGRLTDLALEIENELEAHKNEIMYLQTQLDKEQRRKNDIADYLKGLINILEREEIWFSSRFLL